MVIINQGYIVVCSGNGAVEAVHKWAASTMTIREMCRSIRWALVAVAVPASLEMGWCIPVHGVSQPTNL